MLTLLALLLTAAASDGLTQEEVWATDLALYRTQEVWYYKAPVDAAISAPEKILVTNADTDDLVTPVRLMPQAATLPVHLAIWGSAPKPTISPGHIFGFATSGLPRALVTFSPGASVGKGVYEWRAALCNPSLISAVSIDSGWVEGAAAANGISRTDDSEAATANDLQRNKSRPIVGTLFIKGGLDIGTGVLAMKMVSATGAYGAGFYLGGIAAGYLINYWKSVTVPDFNTRFTAANFLGATGQPYLISPGSCVPKGQIFFSRTGGTTPVANVPIY